MAKEHWNLQITGLVQGIGFRPFVFRLATKLGIFGQVSNSPFGVAIEAEGSHDDLRQFLEKLTTEKPPLSIIEDIAVQHGKILGYQNFTIAKSLFTEESSAETLVLPDLATCPHCLNEIFDPTNRRYFYPFTNCTNCGPRFSIIQKLPYDRGHTTMASFTMCPDCLHEYHDPEDRRFHAQPNACPVCGPQIHLLIKNRDQVLVRADLSGNQEVLEGAVARIEQKQIVACKGIGGYQLLADPFSFEAVSHLRARKRRPTKPFALMMPDIQTVKQYCFVSELEADLLASVHAPIVLLRLRENAINKFPDVLQQGNPYLGVMLPYSPLHHLLLLLWQKPLLVTSGNISNEPICITEDEAMLNLFSIADVFLVHNRPIERALDDSVLFISGTQTIMMRRARGFAPLGIATAHKLTPTLAMGAHLKSSIAITQGNRIIMSQYLGDLDSARSRQFYEKSLFDLKKLFQFHPENIAADLHPDYFSSLMAARAAASLQKEPVRVQHHIAHIFCCIKDQSFQDSYLGFAWDGTGLGSDGTIWGAETFLIQGGSFQRLYSLYPFALLGNDQANLEGRRVALSLLWEIFGKDIPIEIAFMEWKDWEMLALHKQWLGKKFLQSSSLGRLFDGIASLLQLMQRSSFEGEAAMALEFTAGFDFSGYTTQEGYPFRLDRGQILWQDAVMAILDDVRQGKAIQKISLRFHLGLVRLMESIIVKERDRCKVSKIALAGGVFQNRLLLAMIQHFWREQPWQFYLPEEIPINDNGIAAGQVLYHRYMQTFSGEKLP